MGLSSARSTCIGAAAATGSAAAGGSAPLPTAGAGMARTKVLPMPGTLRSVIPPPMRSASWRQIASPRPVPPARRASEVSAWTKCSKTRSCCSAGMPIPVSSTAIWSVPAAAS